MHITKKILKQAQAFLEIALKDNKKRIMHCYNTAQTAVEIAKRNDVDPYRAYFSAFLHDVAKGYDREKTLSAFKRYGITDTYILEDTNLGHGEMGAILTYEVFEDQGLDFYDPLLDAIRYHTYGRASMSLLEKIVYVADLIEPSRHYEGVDRLRSIVLKDFDSGFLECVVDNIKNLLDKQVVIHPNAILMFNDLMKS